MDAPLHFRLAFIYTSDYSHQMINVTSTMLFLLHFVYLCFSFSELHGMPARFSGEKSARLSVHLSVCQTCEL